MNAREQQYINVSEDAALSSAVSIKNSDAPEFLKREETLKRIRDNMQSWHETNVEGQETIRKYDVSSTSSFSYLTFIVTNFLRKGAVKPISVGVKLRQGRKAATLITGFESYFLKADELAEELRKLCASSTSGTYT